MDKLYVGARAKFLVGAGRHLNIDRFDVSPLNEDSWTAGRQRPHRRDGRRAGLRDHPNVRWSETFQLDDADLFVQGAGRLWLRPRLRATYQVPTRRFRSRSMTWGFICWSKSDTRTGVMNKDLNFEGWSSAAPDAPEAD